MGAWASGHSNRHSRSIDKTNGVTVLKREGSGAGPYEGAQDSMTVKKDGKPYKVAIKYGMAHWSGQAVIRQGVIVSDELLCYTPVELSSLELGTLPPMRLFVTNHGGETLLLPSYFSTESQKRSLSPSCSWRLAPAAVITPAVGLCAVAEV